MEQIKNKKDNSSLSANHYPAFIDSFKNRKMAHHFFLKARSVDISTGRWWIVLINEVDAQRLGIMPGDELKLEWDSKTTEVACDITKELIEPGEIGLFADILKQYHIKEGDLVKLSFAKRAPSLQAIYKKLFKKSLTYQEIKSIVNDIVSYRLNDIEIAFFIAPAFDEKNFSEKELYYLTKAIAETGEIWDFGQKIVAVKHSAGGLPGNRITPIIVPIVASFGICIPKTSSRSITSAAGTADALETIMKVEFTTKEIYDLVKKNNSCMVWGGALKLAPADDRFIQITHSLGIEPYSKMVVSVMAKQVAMGVTHLIIDLPVEKTAKISDMETAKKIKEIFLRLSRRFHIKSEVVISKSNGPIGRGIGPALEMRDALRVLQQKDNRPLDLEAKSVKLAGKLLELTGKVKKNQGEKAALDSLISGMAFKKMIQIVEAQGGNTLLDSESLSLGKYIYEVRATNSGMIKSINSRNLVELCRVLGAPELKGSGIYLNKSVKENYKKGDVLFTLYSESDQRLSLALEVLEHLSIYSNS